MTRITIKDKIDKKHDSEKTLTKVAVDSLLSKNWKSELRMLGRALDNLGALVQNLGCVRCDTVTNS
jgi:hypothetical protein